MFSEIVGIECQDGIVYHAQRMVIRSIKEDSDFNGSRIIIPAEPAKARTNLQIDIVLDDSTENISQTIDFPSLLDLPKPNILAYSFALMVAEKFEAIASRQTATSRMKDFFDIAYLAESLPFSGKELQEAFKRTLHRRSTNLLNCKAVFTPEFIQNPGLTSLWKGFLARNGLQHQVEFPQVMETMKCFLEPIIAGVCEDKTWNNRKGVWV